MAQQPFEYRTFVNPYARDIADSIAAPGRIRAQQALNVGDAQARGAEQSGRAWAGAVGGAANAVSGAILSATDPRRKLDEQELEAGKIKLDEMKQRKSDLAALDAAFAKGGSRDLILQSVPAHLHGDVIKQFQEADKLGEQARVAAEAAQKAQQEHIGYLGAQIRQAGYEPSAALAALHQARETYSYDPNLMKQIDQMRIGVIEQPESVKQMADAAMLGSSYKDLLKPEAPVDHNPLHEMRGRDGTLLVPAQAPPPPKPPDPKNYTVTVPGPNGKPVEKLFTEDELKSGVAKYEPPKEPKAPNTAVDDVKQAVSGMKEGTIPPQLPGRASKEYVAIMAEARRQGYDLAGAATDWAATQKHIATLNGSQQTRLTQAINSLPEMLDKVDALSSQWQAGRFPILNKANLALAKGGAYGKDAASIANQLDAQIADVTADLGNVYMGGNSPTDHALGLAAKSLSSDWDAKVLKDMTALARNNVSIRLNSIRNSGVAGASPTNPYAPAPASQPVAAGPSVGTQRVINGTPAIWDGKGWKAK